MSRNAAYVAAKVARQMRWAKRYLFPIIQKHLDSTGPIHGVDLGCGLGANTVALTEQGYRMVGIDTNTDRLVEAADLAETFNVSGKCMFENGTLLGIARDWRRPSRDFAVCLDVIEHAGYTQCLQSAYDLLRVGGIAVFTFPPVTGPFGLHQQTLPWDFRYVPWAGLLFPEEFRMAMRRTHDRSASTARNMDITSGDFECAANLIDFTILTKRRYLIRPERSRFAVRLPNWCPDWMTTSMLYVLQKR